jgi:hypothetical protein
MSDADLIKILLGSSVVGALVGSITTLVGMWRQNKANNRRQKEQLEHNANERRFDRKTEIYLAAAESVAKMQEFLASYMQVDITQAERNEILRGIGGATNKALLVANSESVNSIIKLYECFGQKSILLGEKRLLVDNAAKEMEEYNQELQRFRKEREILTASAQLNELDTKIQQQQKVFSESKDRFNRLELELFNEVAKATLDFENVTAKTNLAIRRELGFEIDEEAYLKIVDSSGKSIRKDLGEMVERVEGTQRARDI